MASQSLLSEIIKADWYLQPQKDDTFLHSGGEQNLVVLFNKQG